MAEAHSEVQVAVGLCFGYAALSKLVAFRSFKEGVASFEMAPTALVGMASASVVALECAVALSFLTDYMRSFGAVVAAVLLATFLLAIGSAHRSGIVAACMCFGATRTESTISKVLTRIALLGIGVAVVLADSLHDPAAPIAPLWATIAAACCVLLGCAAVVEASDVFAPVVRRTTATRWGALREGSDG